MTSVKINPKEFKPLHQQRCIMSQDDCSQWVNGRKKWSEFESISDLELEDFKKFKNEFSALKVNAQIWSESKIKYENRIKELQLDIASLKKAKIELNKVNNLLLEQIIYGKNSITIPSKNADECEKVLNE